MKAWERFEKKVASMIRNEGLSNAHREWRSGAGLRKGDIVSSLPFLLECKDQKKISWLSSIDQAKEQARIGNYNRDKWALIVNDQRKPLFQDIYAVIDFNEFLELLKHAQEPKIKQPDREVSWHLRNLKNAIKEVEKDLNK